MINVYTNRWSVLRIEKPISNPLDWVGVITNYTALQMQYNFVQHASTSNTAPGLSFDKSFPIFDSSLRDVNLLVAATARIDVPQATSEEIALMTGYGFTPFTVSRPPDTSSLAVSVSPSQGIALSTAFSINCSGGNTHLVPLSYSIGYLLGGAIYTNQSNSRALASSCFWLTQKRKLYRLFCEFIC